MAEHARAVGAQPSSRSRESREPIAIVGMGCRFAGVIDVESFWEVLAEGRETLGEYPGGRFPYVDEVYAAGSRFASRIASRRGGFIPGLDQFDADFFGISPREAALLDPQQRLLLEVAWEAVDDAGLVRERLAGTRTGVFVGMWAGDYEDCMYEASPDVDIRATTGGGRYGVSARLAYFLDLRGPNLTVDTACSSALVAIHLACQSLVTGESAMALAGGVNLILRPEITLAYSSAGMLSRDGRCKFGDASADGYVRSEGAGIVLLKRLSDALVDGDSIYAVIRGSAVNYDGQSSGRFVLPSRAGQEDVIRTALDCAGVNADDVAYVEAHGTGTRAGDPVEVEAIGRVMTSATRAHPCRIGSVKTNIGHTESAAGVAGVMKVALALDRGLVPPSLHFVTPSPLIPWDELPVTIPTTAVSWPNSDCAPVAGVNGFGITGTNAHVLLQRYENRAHKAADRSNARPFLFLLSAQTSDALRAVASSWIERLDSDSSWPLSPADLAYTAAVRHTHHDYRLGLTALDRDDLVSRLSAWLDGAELAGVVSDRRVQLASGKAVFVYPGQGGQWLGMGRTLLDREPVFHDALVRCDAAIAKHAGWSVIDELRAAPEASRLDEIDVVQPTLFGVMVALTELWRSLGVEPSAVVGHSMGEAAAAAVAGALSLEDAAAVICHRSRLMKRLSGLGAMAVVELGLDDTRELVGGVERVWVAASNSATSTVISGDVNAVESVLASLEAREIFCRRIKVDVASHSGHMDAVRAELETALAHVKPRVGTLPIYSTTTGEVEDGSRLDATYWGKNLRQPVLFHPAVERLLGDDFDAFVEINAHPVLTHSLSESIELSGREAVVTGSLRRDVDEQVELLSAVGKLHSAGFPVDFARMYPNGVSLRLPVYPWQRERHWFEGTQVATVHRLENAAGIKGNEDALADRADGLYTMDWTDAAVPAVTSHVRSTDHWIVLANEPIGDRLAVQLTVHGGTCTLIRPGTAFRVIGPDEFEVNPLSEDDFRKALGDRIARCHGIVHAWSLSGDDRIGNLSELRRDQSFDCGSVVCLVRSIPELATGRSLALWIATRGVHAVSSDSTTIPWHSPLWGIGRIIAVEYPELSCTNLDISVVPGEDEIANVAQLLRESVVEQRVAVRGTRRFVARYRKLASRSASPQIRPDGTYLIAGGLGGIGLLTARWLVKRGARYIALAGRSAPSVDAEAILGELRGLGATVNVIATDVADTSQVARLLGEINSAMPPLKGVFHMAVAVDHALVRDASMKSFQDVMAPKISGAWNLYHSLQRETLDFCVFYSSLVVAMPQPRSASYAAANAFLDALAIHGSLGGAPIRSIQWGPWLETGILNERTTRGSSQMYDAQGIRSMSPELGLALLDRALAAAVPVTLAVSADWERFTSVCGTDPGASEFAELGTRALSVADTEPRAAESVRESLDLLPAGRPRLAAIEAHLREHLAVVLKMSPNRIDVKRSMGTMGVDSLMALEFTRRLSRSLDVKVPATLIFNYPTLRKLAVLLQARMESKDAEPPAQPHVVAASAAAVGDDVAEMSDLDAVIALSARRGTRQ